MMNSFTTHLRHGNNYMRRNREVIEPKGHATDIFSGWAGDYLRERAKTKQPFFLYLAYNAPHFPIEPPGDWLAKVKARAPQLDEKVLRSELGADRPTLGERVEFQSADYRITRSPTTWSSEYSPRKLQARKRAIRRLPEFERTPAAHAAEADLVVSDTGRITENGRPPISVIKRMVDKLSSCTKEMTVSEIGDAATRAKCRAISNLSPPDILRSQR